MIKQTEQTYGLMMHMSQALGVNCTYCHNIALVRVVGDEHAAARDRLLRHPHGARSQHALPRSLAGVFPPNRLGPDRRRAEAELRHLPPGRIQAALRRQHPERPSGPHGGVDGRCRRRCLGRGRERRRQVLLRHRQVRYRRGRGRSARRDLAPVAAGGSAVVSGFNDPTGDAAKNEELAKQRAFAVRDALKSAGIADDKIQLKKPEATTGTGTNAEARRVEVAVMK